MCGSLHHRYTWYKNGAAIVQTERLTTKRGDLIIKTAFAEDSGMYSCNASNSHGAAVISTRLLISGIYTCVHIVTDCSRSSHHCHWVLKH